MKGKLMHPRTGGPGPDFHENIMWEGVFPEARRADLEASLGCMRAKGYWASLFPEGDGVVFNKDLYDPERGDADVRGCFPWLALP